jgi:hypothetical protein
MEDDLTDALPGSGYVELRAKHELRVAHEALSD